jgi:hypothetical protein
MRSPDSMQRQTYGNNQGYDSMSQSLSGGFRGRRSRPKRLDIFLHASKTFKLIGALLADRRIPLWRKALFFSSIGGLLVLLLFPDALNEFVLSTVVPLAGTIVGIPIDAGFDWIAFALAIVSLLRFFPPELVAEHYRYVFRR